MLCGGYRVFCRLKMLKEKCEKYSHTAEIIDQQSFNVDETAKKVDILSLYGRYRFVLGIL